MNKDENIFKTDCFYVALTVASLIAKETSKSKTIDNILKLTKQILDINTTKNLESS
jgi:hypothetical protein